VRLPCGALDRTPLRHPLRESGCPQTLQQVIFLVLPDFVVDEDMLAGGGDEEILKPVVVIAETVEFVKR
jgi:hypothetical protein